MKEIRNKVSEFVLIAYFIVLIIIWGAVELHIWPHLREINFFGGEFLSTIVKSGFLKNLVWTLPALLLIRHYEDQLSLSTKDMFTNRINIRHYLPVFVFFTVFLFTASLVINGKIAISADFRFTRVIIAVFAGITEEIVFRGWLLNAALTKDIHSKSQIRMAVLANAFLFLIIHFPRWLHEGIFLASFHDFSFLSVMILSIIFSWAFIKSKSIFVPMALHTYWDLVAFLLL